MRPSNQSQSGQSLLETIVAIFVLVTALVAGLGLALYALTNSADAKSQIVASNLAREGIEVIRMMRDSNWLAAEDDAQIADLTTCTYPMPAPNNTHLCYPEAFGVNGSAGTQFDLESEGSSDDYYRLTFRPGDEWEMEQRFILRTYFLCLQADGTYQHNDVFGPSCDDAKYARRVSISTGSTAQPFTSDSSSPSAAAGHSPEKIITSTVVWQGKNCTAFPTDFFGMLFFNPDDFVTRCKVQITEHLTNWKDYR